MKIVDVMFEIQISLFSRKFGDVLKKKRRSKRISYKKSASLDGYRQGGSGSEATPPRASSLSSVPTSMLASLRSISMKNTTTPTSKLSKVGNYSVLF